MLPVTSYTTLVAAILDLAEDVGVELQDYLPVAIDLAEQKLTKELDILGLQYVSSPISLGVGVTTITKPADHKLTYFLRIVNPTTQDETILERRQDDYLIEYWGRSKTPSTPKYYSDIDETTFRIVPGSTQVTSVVVHGVRRPTALSTSNQTNTFTRQASNALLFASMMEVATWQRNDSMYQKYVVAYNEARDGLNNEGRRQRRDNTEAPGNVDPSVNTLLGSN